MRIADMSFPASDTLKRGFWQPVYFRPNLDTPERLVAAVIGNVEGRWELIRASAPERLKCLYGREAAVALEAIEIGLEHLESTLRRGEIPVDVSDIVSGLEIGDKVAAQGNDARELATRWVRLISSLHDVRTELRLEGTPALVVGTDPIERDISRDRLPVLVMERMTQRAPEARSMFNPHVLRLEREHGARLLTHKAFVAFSGKHVAANFATLKPGRQKVAVDISKRLMWDLEQHREKEDNLLPRQSHEMILYHPSEDDPTITPKQYDNVMEVVRTLKDEGNNRQINVRSYVSVPKIAEHILKAEELG